MNFKKIMAFSLFLTLFEANSTQALPSPKSAAIGAVATVALLGSTHAYGWFRNYAITKTLHGDYRKHTWNYLEEYFPTKYEMDQAEGDFHLLVQRNIKTFKTDPQIERIADPLYLVHFIKETSEDLAILNNFKCQLQGNPERLASLIKANISNATLFRGLRNQIEEVHAEVCRYEKRLKQIIHSIVNSYEYAVQLQLKQQQHVANRMNQRHN